MTDECLHRPNDVMHLAQLNIGRLRYPKDDPRLAGWRDNVSRIFALAERSAGFVWRMSGDAGMYTGARMYGDDRIVSNMSVWASVEAFRDFTYRTVHARFVDRRADWFDRIEGHHAMWWIPEGTIPDLLEGRDRIEHLRAHGPTPHAFDFNRAFPPSAGTAIGEM